MIGFAARDGSRLPGFNIRENVAARSRPTVDVDAATSMMPITSRFSFASTSMLHGQRLENRDRAVVAFAS